jgi:alkaline phosphatase
MHKAKTYFRLIITVIILFRQAVAQKYSPWKILSKRADWSVANAHSHNDYQQIHPFTSAYQARFGSMEADILLSRDSLYIGHSESDIQNHRLFSILYLDSIRFYCRKNAGFIFKNKTRTLQLLIDIKTAAEPTLDALIRELQKYPDLIHSPAVFFVITGNRPAPEKWSSYPDYIYFDGDAGKKYLSEGIQKVAMLSGNFASFSSWNRNANPDSTTLNRLSKIINEAHKQGKRIRFWNAPDNPEAWLLLISLGVDWINTDHITELVSFLRQP